MLVEELVRQVLEQQRFWMSQQDRCRQASRGEGKEPPRNHLNRSTYGDCEEASWGAKHRTGRVRGMEREASYSYVVSIQIMSIAPFQQQQHQQQAHARTGQGFPCM